MSTRCDRILDVGQNLLQTESIRSSRSLQEVDFSSSTSTHQSFSPTPYHSPFAHPHTFFRKPPQPDKMHFSILFTPFIAGVLALPVPQAGVSRGTPVTGPKLVTRTVTNAQQTGLGDVMSGLAQGTNNLLSGGANNAVSSTGNSVADVSNSAGNLVNRQAGVSTIAPFFE